MLGWWELNDSVLREMCFLMKLVDCIFVVTFPSLWSSIKMLIGEKEKGGLWNFEPLFFLGAYLPLGAGYTCWLRVRK